VKEELLSIRAFWLDLVETLFYLISILLFSIYLRKRSLKINSINSFSIFRTLVFVVFLALIYRIAEDPILRFYQLMGGNFNLFSSYSKYTNIELIILGLNVIILAPILEELIFRKGMLDLFDRKNFAFSVLLSSLMFAAIHANGIANNYITILASFLFGVVTCVIYLRFNIIVSIVFHVTYNIVWYILEIRKADYWKLISELDFNLVYWFIQFTSVAVIGLSLYGMISKKKKE